MIYYQYVLNWKQPVKKNNSEKDECFGPVYRNEFESKYSEDAVNTINSDSRNEYQRNGDFLMFVTKRTETTIELCVAVNINSIGEANYEDKILSIFNDCVISRKNEITIEDFRRELSTDRYYGVSKTLGLLKIDYRSGFFDPFPFDKEEKINQLPRMTKKQCVQRAKKILASKTMLEEIDRIYSKSNVKKYYGHPVHYLLSAGDWEAAMDMSELLITALESNERLLSGRQTILRDFRKGVHRDDRYKQILEASEGGVVIIELKGQESIENLATDFHEFTRLTGEYMSKLKKDTLFIFVELMGKSLKDGDALYNITSKADIIQIEEGSGTLKQAQDYLMELVNKAEFEVDDKEEAFEYLPKAETYTVTDIFTAYNTWYGSGLKTHVYKAYKDKKSFKVAVTPVENKPYDELQQLIGLTEQKKIIDRIISAGKVKCMRERMGLNTESTALHMCFTGTPGTCKTTVARLISKILKEECVVKSGNFVECGRQDLVGKYVGWTAKIVEEKFRAAQGGVLFIDEAYALVDDSNTYGAEAINTITQLMENYRDQVIVIFAGYPEKMHTFLVQNEGLRSRISFHLDFPDYTSSELVEIMRLMCSKREYEVSEDAYSKCRDIFEQAARVENFGNGRYVRNVLEQAILRQSDRILKEAAAAGCELTKAEITALKACDFSFVPLSEKTNLTRIGFAV